MCVCSIHSAQRDMGVDVGDTKVSKRNNEIIVLITWYQNIGKDVLEVLISQNYPVKHKKYI